MTVVSVAVAPIVLEDDAALVERARAHDGAAFATLYARHSRTVARVAHRLLGDDGDVDDVVQETFVEAAASLDDLESGNAIRAWLVRVAVRRVHRLLARRRRRRVFAGLIAYVSARSSDPRDRQPVDELYDALDRIPQDLRVAWVLHRVEQLTLPDVAQVCEVSLATVKRRIADAEARIARRLAP